MKKIANITWITYHNYGTFLQAYALQQYINSLGYQSIVLNDEFIIENKISWKAEIRRMIGKLNKDYRMFLRSQKDSANLYKQFKREHIVLDNNISDIDYLNRVYDCFVCGSDQIWNPFSFKNTKNDFFYADFAKKKKVAYAPSIGVASIPKEYVERFKKLIQDFSFLSARERQGKEVMEKLTGKIVYEVVDPTLLLGQGEWRKLINNSHKATQKYVLGYFLTPNPIYINIAKEYAHEMGYEFRMLYTNRSYSAVADKLITAGPVEFLKAIHNAQYVFTDSFHGSIFSSIFRIQFVTFKRFKNTITSQNSRVENLLRIMNLENHLIGIEDISKIYTLEKIDFNNVWERLSSIIEESKQYLSVALK